MKLRILAAALVMLAAPASAQDARYLPFTGAWVGVGEGREGPNAPWERATCNVTIEWQRGLRSHAVCEGARGRFTAGGVLDADGTGDFLVPHFVDTAEEPVVALAGDAIVSTYVFEDLGVVYQFRLTVRPAGPARLTMTTELLLDGVYVEVGRLALAPE